MLVLVALAAAALPVPKVQAAIKEAIGRELKDPFSAQYDWQPVKSDMVYCGWVNAKNSYGAYDGYKPFMVLYMIGNKSGVAKVLSTEMAPHVVTPMCLKEGYRITR